MTTKLPSYMLSRDGKLKGEIIGTRRCQMAGCGAEAFIVRWPNKRRTIPCGKGCKTTEHPDTVQIV